MGYVGTAPVTGDYRKLDDIASGFNGVETAFTLQVGSVNVTPPKETTVIISVGGILQEPLIAYTISGSILTFTSAPAAGAGFFGIMMGDAYSVGVPSDGTVTELKMAANSVNSDQYVDGSIDLVHMSVNSVDSDQYVDGSIDTAHIADNQVTLAKVADIARGSLIVGNASAATAELTKGTASQVLTSDGTDIAWAAAAAGYSDAEAIAAVEGEATLALAGDVEIADSKFIEFASAAGTPTTDNKVQGIVIEFLAVEAITQFDAVYVSTTTGRVGRALATNAAKMPVIGIAIEAQATAGSSVRVLTHGVYRDDDGFGGNMTVGTKLYAPEVLGTLTTTIPTTTGDLIQVMGVATGLRSAFINPSMDIIEHA